VLNDLAQHARNQRELERSQTLEEEAQALWVQSGVTGASQFAARSSVQVLRSVRVHAIASVSRRSLGSSCQAEK
jgi:hypothetical protein